MNSFIDLEAVRVTNRIHYDKSNRLRAYCCGCISGESNLTFVCFLWAVISFYFAVLAFLQKSPFYSYVDTVPLVAFGAINLLFGIVTSTCMVLYISWTHSIRITPVENMYGMGGSKRIVFAITANALGVLIVTLVNFILFVRNKADFNRWCIGESINYVEDEYSSVNNNTSLPLNKLSNTTDVYNCERLYQDEVKWSLLCLIIMFIVYIHWILIIAAREAYDFYFGRRMGPPMSEFSNIAPRSKKSKKLNVFYSIKPSKSILKELLTHKQYGEFIPAEDLINGEKSNTHIANDPAKTVDEQINSNVIHFEDNIYSSKEIQTPCNAFHKGTSLLSSGYSTPDSASTLT